jgi:Flp pilus assembly protein TadG
MKNDKGQALTEMLLVVPLLLGLVLGLAQFIIFFSARSAFEYACGQTARQYSCGLIPDDAGSGFSSAIWNGLGSYQRFFDPSSLSLSTSALASQAAGPFQGALGFLPGPAGTFISKTQNALLNYSGDLWVVSVRYQGLSFGKILAPRGVVLQTQMAVLKYPGEPSHEK